MTEKLQLGHFDNMVLLRNCPLFSGLAPSQLQRLVMLIRERNYRDGDIILEAGTTLSSLLVVKYGSCELGERCFGEGEIILEPVVFIPNYNLKSSLKAEGNTTLVTISQSDIYELLLHNPTTSVRLIERFAGKLIGIL